MYGNGRQWSFIDILTMFDTFLQMADFDMNMRQVGNNTIMEGLQHQNEVYLKKIIENQKEILNNLDMLSKSMSADR